MNNTGILKREQEYTEMKQLLRGIAHEMGNALTVMGYSIKSLGKNADVQDNEHWNDLNADFDYICRLYKNLSAYNNSRDLKLEEVKLDKILVSLVSSVCNEYIDEGVSITYEGVTGASIVGDEVKLRQVFINIIKNAYEAVKVGKHRGAVMIAMTEIEDVYEVSVKDNGCGIAPESLCKIFEPMYTEKETGTGLGLPVCKNIVESHGGKISVISKPGVGTEFKVELKKNI